MIKGTIHPRIRNFICSTLYIYVKGLHRKSKVHTAAVKNSQQHKDFGALWDW